ncbi:telomerase reverse transcriptase-like [Dorcoceras hygrometricum]|uniref:Telomerase reverse transcriptase-like n=1 Tax=Dorcoceras hygrometricum TaxID=472368 RepID=A0A2Z7CJ84_9LAMI|nr:telomerase reverse transcriptase-like [Dorcoceras hygrometricum]
MQHAIINAMKCMRAINDRIARPVYQLANHLNQPLYPHGVSTKEIIGINNKGKAQNQEELLPRSSKLTNKQPDQISQESSKEQQLCASSSIRTTATNKVAIEKGTLKEPSAT